MPDEGMKESAVKFYKRNFGATDVEIIDTLPYHTYVINYQSLIT